jgi:hypothetical protein
MSAPLRTLPIVARLVLAAVLLCGMTFGQTGFSQRSVHSCHRVAAASDCQPCCAAMPCCLASHRSGNTPALPEPLGNDSGHSSGHGLAAVTLTLIPTFDFLPPPSSMGATVFRRTLPLALVAAPRGAVSCIWLI